MQFEWDVNKNNINKQKHKVSFDLAKQIFFDKYRLEYYDYESSDEEDRWITIGKIDTIFIKAFFTIRKDNIRLISARLANAKERNYYRLQFRY